MITQQQTPRIAHCRFLNRDPIHKMREEDSGYYNRIVTSAWSYDVVTSILTYGATVYTKSEGSKCWVKKTHRDRATERYYKNPIRVKLIYSRNKVQLSDIAMDWYIAEILTFMFGACSKDISETVEQGLVTQEDVKRNNTEQVDEVKEITEVKEVPMQKLKIHGIRFIQDDFNMKYDPRCADESESVVYEYEDDCYSEYLHLLAYPVFGLAAGLAYLQYIIA